MHDAAARRPACWQQARVHFEQARPWPLPSGSTQGKLAFVSAM